jgi:transposase-like protein
MAGGLAMMKKQTPGRMQRLVARWRTSGESGAGFARRHGIPAWTFWYWCRKLLPAQPTPTPSTAQRFVPVQVASPADAPVVEIVFQEGTRLQVRAGAPPELVRSAIAALRAAC